jgi:hypothetical protein
MGVFVYVCNRVYDEFPVKVIGVFLWISGQPISISFPQGEKLAKKRKIKIN